MNNTVFMLVIYALAAVLVIDGIMTCMHRETLKKENTSIHHSVLDIYDGIILIAAAYTVICFAYRTVYQSDLSNKLMWIGIILVLIAALIRFVKAGKKDH